MLIMVEDRPTVSAAYSTSFKRYGIKLECLNTASFLNWLQSPQCSELESVDCYLLGRTESIPGLIKLLRFHSKTPILALVDSIRIDTVIEYYESGIDDILRKPMHVREIIYRANTARRRSDVKAETPVNEDCHVFSDGRNPIVGGEPLELPRRERRLLEYLVARAGRRVTKEQIFNSIYGIFEENVNESVVESHISKLRKKLRQRLGYDPIDSKRYLGYCFNISTCPTVAMETHMMAASARH